MGGGRKRAEGQEVHTTPRPPPRFPAGGCAPLPSPLSLSPSTGRGRRLRASAVGCAPLPSPSPSRLRPHPSIPHGFSAYKPHGVGRIAHPHLVRSPRQLQYPWPSAPSGRCRAPARAPLPAPARRGRPDARGGGRIGEAATAMGGQKPAPVRNRYQRSGGSAAHGIAAQGGAALSQRPL